MSDEWDSETTVAAIGLTGLFIIFCWSLWYYPLWTGVVLFVWGVIKTLIQIQRKKKRKKKEESALQDLMVTKAYSDN